MNCEDALDRIDAGETDNDALRAHVAACAGCREAEAAITRLGAAARALPTELEPGRDLWPEIAEQLTPRATVVPLRPRRTLAFSPATLAAAAALLVALTAAFTTLLLRPADAPLVAEQATIGVARAVALSPQASVAAAESEYLTAQGALLERIRAHADELGPETVATVEANVKVIDAALAEIRAALGQAPDSPALVRMLTRAHRKKLDALQRVARSL